MNSPSYNHSCRVAHPENSESTAADEKATRNLPQNPTPSVTQFPWRLHQMLKTVEMEGNSSIISWLPGEPQNSFKVHKKEEFMEKVLPCYFHQTKFKSFLRQLNLWGFERILDQGPFRGGYRHSLFIKTRPELCSEMKRRKTKGIKEVDSGNSLQRLARIAQAGSESPSRNDDGAAKAPSTTGTTTGSPDNISTETIDYEKIPPNVPVAAELSRMYAEDMTSRDESLKETPDGGTSSAPNSFGLSRC